MKEKDEREGRIMKLISTDYLNELLEDFKVSKFSDESFQEFVERTSDDGEYLAKDLERWNNETKKFKI